MYKKYAGQSLTPISPLHVLKTPKYQDVMQRDFNACVTSHTCKSLGLAQSILRVYVDDCHDNMAHPQVARGLVSRYGKI
jgi:hypothetical protein